MFDREKFICEFLAGSLSDEELIEAAKLLEDPSLADQIVKESQVHDLLLTDAALTPDDSRAPLVVSFQNENSTNADGSPRRKSDSHSDRRVRMFRRSWMWAGVTAIACLAAVFLNHRLREKPNQAIITEAPAVARISRTVNVQWLASSQRWSVGDRLRPGDRVELAAGRVELIYDSDAVMSLAGPVALEVLSAVSVSLEYGTATTRVEHSDAGEFKVLTPSASVVDLGTEFGVSAKPDGATAVAVFEGAVDLHPLGGENLRFPARRLSSGQALQTDGTGAWERLVSVDDDAFPFGSRLFDVERVRPSVIRGITDNHRSSESPNFYRICHEGLAEDSRAFVDRIHEWNGLTAEGLPAFLRGADYVQTFNDDKWVDDLEITLDLSGPAMLYLLYDDRQNVPQWLSETFEDTGFDIGLDEGAWDASRPKFHTEVGAGNSIDRTFSIWRLRIETPTSIEFGPVGEPIIQEKAKGKNMFGIAVQPLS